MRIVIALSALLAMPVMVVAESGSSASTPAGGSESLGNQLLNDLAPIVPQKPATPSQAVQNGATNDGAAQLGNARFDELGEDVNQPSGPLSLVRVRRGMQRAESLLGQPAATGDAGAVDRAATVQEQVIDQLDRLISELSKQCRGGQRPPGNQGTGNDQQSQAKPGNSSNAVAKGNTAARDSSERLDASSPMPVTKADIEELAKQFWGHLPERTREQMMQSFSEEFLPKYERDIEEYYRRLSEEKNAGRTQQ
jgi:hypothetical protein